MASHDVPEPTIIDVKDQLGDEVAALVGMAMTASANERADIYQSLYEGEARRNEELEEKVAKLERRLAHAQMKVMAMFDDPGPDWFGER